MTTKTTQGATRWTRFAAVGVLVAAACLAAVWVLPRTSDAAAAWLETTPVTLHTMKVSGDLPVRDAHGASTSSDDAEASPAATAAASSSGVVTLDPGMSFTMIGLTCSATHGEDAVTVFVRTSEDGDSWSAWQKTPLQATDSTEGSTRSYTDPLWTGSGRYVQVRAQSAASGAPTSLEGVRVLAIDPVEDATAKTAVLGALRRAAATVANIGAAAPAAASVNEPDIVTRSQWGADESLRGSSPSYATVKMAFVHHTASGNTYTAADGPALVRGIYAYHTTGLGWNDIGYNFLIDRYGTIYEGRYGGVTRGVVGAQVLGFNTGSTGISVIGTFTRSEPPAAALTSLKNLLAWKLTIHDLKPSGTASMTCGSTEKYKKDATVELPVIAGHRDANYTECPGTKLYALLPSIRTSVAGLMKLKWVPKLTLSTSYARRGTKVTYRGKVLSTSGDCATGKVAIQRRVATSSTWKTWRTAPLTSSGKYSITVRMTNRQTWKYRAKMPGKNGVSTGYSRQRKLTIR